MSELLELVHDKRKDALEELREHAPTIALVVANIGVAYGEYRVYDIVSQLTGSTWKGIGAILSTGVPFLVWEFVWQYRHARGLQQALALIGALFALLCATLLGVADYQQGVTQLPAGAILTGVVLALAVHVVALFLFFFTDPRIEAERHTAEAEASMQRKKDDMLRANALLATAKEVLAFKRNLERQYGKAEVAAIVDQLAGRKTAIASEPAPQSVGTTRNEQPTEDDKPVHKLPTVLEKVLAPRSNGNGNGNGREPTDFH